MTRYYKNRTNRHANVLVKRFKEELPTASSLDVLKFRRLARCLYKATDPQDIEAYLTIIKDFCDEVEQRYGRQEADQREVPREIEPAN
jgi:hypothetical protein